VSPTLYPLTDIFSFVKGTLLTSNSDFNSEKVTSLVDFGSSFCPLPRESHAATAPAEVPYLRMSKRLNHFPSFRRLFISSLTSSKSLSISG